ncbi:MAG: hypothetical protein KatS3mg028_1206 [Bacteroidia bacterium]|nr:MAG: hypothetical protein KatS3mg028_1206 [Bacteroidia bacterium]
MEIRAGTGGDEAAIFAGDLFEMYKRYCDKKGFQVEVSGLQPRNNGRLQRNYF